MKFKDIIKSNPISIILMYLISMLISSLLGLALFSSIASNKFGLSFKECFSITSMSLSDFNNFSNTQKDCYLFIHGYTNFFQYILMFILIGLFSIDYLKEDLKKFKNNLKRNIIFMILGAILFTLLNQGITDLISLIVNKISDVKTSSNEGLISLLIKNHYAVIMFISITIFAPFVEEMVYRKSIFKLTKKNRWIQILLSAFIFALPHMLSDLSVWYVWILLFLNYFICGILLSAIYSYSGENVYISIFCHLVSNLVAFILIILQ